MTVLVLAELGLGWRAVSGPPIAALLHGLGIGAVSVLVYASAGLVTWRIAGQPQGAETLAGDRRRAAPLSAFATCAMANSMGKGGLSRIAVWTRSSSISYSA